MVTVGLISRYIGICFFWIFTIFLCLYAPRLLHIGAQRRSINVCMWPGVVDKDVIADFEKQTGISVRYSSFDSNEELLVKLFATKGKEYDLIITSDYCIEVLIKQKLLQKINKSKLDFWSAIHPAFLGHYYDEHNDYSIPSDWYVLGFGIKKNFFRDTFHKNISDNSTWDIVFDVKNIDYTLGMINDSRELASLAMYYLYKKVAPVNDQQVQEITDLLIQQKSHVEAYTDLRGDFLLQSGNCAVVLVPNSFMWKVLARDATVDFFLPTDGLFLNIENFAIPVHSEKSELVYEFINYLFKLDIQEHNFTNNAMLSVRKDADFMFNNPYLQSSMRIFDENQEKPTLFRNMLTDAQLNHIWLSMKGL